MTGRHRKAAPKRVVPVSRSVKVTGKTKLRAAKAAYGAQRAIKVDLAEQLMKVYRAKHPNPRLSTRAVSLWTPAVHTTAAGRKSVFAEFKYDKGKLGPDRRDPVTGRLWSGKVIREPAYLPTGKRKRR